MVFNTTTNALGQATLTLRGGGCVNATGAAVIRANGVIVRSYDHAKSPDWDGAGCNLAVDLSDLIRFTTSPPDLCFDFDNDGDKDLSDTILFTSGYTPAHSCP
jgi:hypothetical protein